MFFRIVDPALGFDPSYIKLIFSFNFNVPQCQLCQAGVATLDPLSNAHMKGGPDKIRTAFHPCEPLAGNLFSSPDKCPVQSCLQPCSCPDPPWRRQCSPRRTLPGHQALEIGRASGWERLCTSVYLS